MKNRILYIGPNAGTSLQRQRAFIRMGFEIESIDLRKLLPNYSLIDKIEWHVSPSLLATLILGKVSQLLEKKSFLLCFVDNGSLVSEKIISKLRLHCKYIVNFNHDDPFGGRDDTRFSAYRNALHLYDLVVVVRQENQDEAKRAGAKKILHTFRVADEVAHAPKALTTEIINRWKSDIVFVGTWMEERDRFFVELINKGLPISIFGARWERSPNWKFIRSHFREGHLEGDAYSYAIQCSKIALCLLSKGNRDRHTTRSMEIPSLGTVLCAERTDDHLALYKDGVEAVFWSDAEECVRQCNLLLSNDVRLKAVARAGHERFLQNGHTTENLIGKIFSELNLEI
ncbi:CgeB family protein [Pseudacidovorax intermedius]|uniref:CgeB family protein n=1 Tax=Pseudacidovorax intermedius TaxID=433924 RepID=UPI0009DBA518|nr:glycosyltransferase [Pseudacidovorax intermedius]